MPKRPDYGIDAPGVLVTLVLIGVAGQILGLFAPPLKIGRVTIVFGVSMQITGGIFLLEGVLMIVYVKWGKFRHRDRMLAQVPWTGNERVLDVGAGSSRPAVRDWPSVTLFEDELVREAGGSLVRGLQAVQD